MTSLMSGRLLGAVIGGVALLGVAASPVAAQTQAVPKHKNHTNTQTPAGNDQASSDQQQKKADDTPVTKAKVGEAAPAFTLTDTDGKTVNLSDYKGKIVVLEWFNPDCPIVKGLYANNVMQKTQDAFKGKDVAWLAINSGGAGNEGAGKERNVKARTDWKMTQPVLLDESGKVGHLYGATNTPHMFVIDKNGVLAYAGAIDDGGPGKPGKTNYVENAVNQLIKGETVTPSHTKAYGCNVKYAKQSS